MTIPPPPATHFDPRRLIPESVRSRWFVMSVARSRAMLASTFLIGLAAGARLGGGAGSARAKGLGILLSIAGVVLYAVVSSFERRRSDELCDAICRASGPTVPAPVTQPEV